MKEQILLHKEQETLTKTCSTIYLMVGKNQHFTKKVTLALRNLPANLM